MASDALTLGTAKEKLERLRTQLSNLRGEAKHVAQVGVRSVLVVAGGAAAGAIQAKMPFLPNTQVPTAGVVGAGLITLAMSGMLDDQGDNAAFFGAGLLAAIAARETEKALSAA